MTAFTWLGSFDAANLWRPFAEAQLNQMKRLGLPLKRSYFVANAEISIQLNPPLIHIKAASNLLFTIDGFNFVNVYDIKFFNDEIVICGRTRDQPGQYDYPLSIPGVPQTIRWSGFVVILDKDLKVRVSILVDSKLANPSSEFDYRLAQINTIETDTDFIYASGSAEDDNGQTLVNIKFDKDLNVINKRRVTSLVTGGAIDTASNDTELFIVTTGTIEKVNKSLSFISGKFLYPIVSNKSIRAVKIKDDFIYVLVNDKDVFLDTRVVILTTSLAYQKSVLIQGLDCLNFDVDDFIYVCGSLRDNSGKPHGAIVKLDLNLNIINDKAVVGAYNSAFSDVKVFNGIVFATGYESIKVDPGEVSTQEEINQGFEEAHNGIMARFDSNLELISSRQVDDPKDGSLYDLIIDNDFVYATGEARIGLIDEAGGLGNRSSDGVISRWDKTISGQGGILDITDIHVEKSIQNDAIINYQTSPDTEFVEQSYDPTYVASDVVISDWDIELTGGAF